MQSDRGPRWPGSFPGQLPPSLLLPGWCSEAQPSLILSNGVRSEGSRASEGGLLPVHTPVGFRWPGAPLAHGENRRARRASNCPGSLPAALLSDVWAFV